MRVATTLSVAAALVVALVVGPHVGAEDDLTDGADAAKTATRGTTAQVTPTAPPPSVAPGDSLDVPANSGSGRRVVYSKGIMRVWLIEADGTLYDTHRVSGRFDRPNFGTYTVWSRSPYTCARKRPDICMRFMVRFAWAPSGDNIGFHEIPQQGGVPLQTEEQLGESLSGGCVRQVTADAILMWDWAQIGTVVVVVP